MSNNKKIIPRRLPKKYPNGRLVNVPSKPLDLVPRPWYPITVRISTLAGSTLNFADLFAHLRSQVGLTSSSNMLVRLQHVKIWGPVVSTSSNTTTGQLHIRFYDPITNNPTQEAVRYPDVVNRSTVGYVYSDTVQATPVGTPQANTVLQFLSPVASEVVNCIIYIHVLWRFSS
jgi:hypothetical protein